MADQHDLFGAAAQAPAPAPATRPAVQHFPAPPSLEWAKLLTAYGSPQVIIHASSLWTRVVLEVLAVGLTGRWGIQSDRTIVSFRADAGSRARIIYFAPADVAALHRTHPLIRIGTAGQYSARYRFALPGEVTAPEIELPPGDGS